MIARTTETNHDPLITFREVLEIVGRPGLAVSTVHRWRSPGVLVSGQRARLEAKRVGGKWYSRRTWLAEFLAACNPVNHEPVAPPVLDQDQQRRAELAGAQLDAMLHPKRGRPRKVAT